VDLLYNKININNKSTNIELTEFGLQLSVKLWHQKDELGK